MNTKQLVRTSKFLSLILRHQPERIGVSLDEHGWADVEELIAKTNQSGVKMNLEILKEVVAKNNKKRFAFSKDGRKIRASQGHSISVDLDLKAIQPPELLYHGTATQFLKSIEVEGLVSKKRHHVHLSPDEKTAISVGQRHGKPVVLIIKAGEMARQGYEFYLSENGVWLTKCVPKMYVDFPETYPPQKR